MDIVVYGATGFTGRLAAAYLAEHAPDVEFAVAGRNREKLEALGLGAEIRVADSTDPDSVDRMVQGAKVVVTTAGPYQKYGSPVVEACVRHGVDYVDITGETHWVRDMIDQHHDAARDKGVRIVPFCGFDSIPSDIGVWLLADHAQRTWGEELRVARGGMRARGGFNGGTLDTVYTSIETGSGRRQFDPELLNADARIGAAKDQNRVFRDEKLGWLHPFIMAVINTRVVRRSNMLLGYGDPFAYDEYQRAGGRRKAYGRGLALGAAFAMLQKKPTRALIKRLMPSPGEGPSEASMDSGFMQMTVVGRTAGGHELTSVVAGDGDPGNRNTVRMLCESALALVRDRDQLPDRAGLLTPAAAFEGVLVERLRSAGMELTVREG